MASGPYFDPRRGTWTVQYHDGTCWRRVTVVRRRPDWKPGGPPPRKVPLAATEAFTYYCRLEQDARVGKSDAGELSIESFLVSYRESYRLNRSPKSAWAFDRATRWFLRYCGKEGITKTKHVTFDRCEGYAKWRIHDCSAAWGSVNQERGLLMGAWTTALKAGRVRSNPWSKIHVPGKKPPDPMPSWTPKEFDRLLRASKPWLRDLLTIGVNTGIRISALRNLLWADVLMYDGGGGFVAVRPENDKVGRGYRVPLSRRCREVLEEMAARRKDSPYVLVGQAGGRIRSNNHTYDAINLAIKRAGLPAARSPNHAMRRTFGRWAVLGHLTGRPIPLHVVSKWMGHSSIAMTERYLHLSDDDSRDWMADTRMAEKEA